MHPFLISSSPPLLMIRYVNRSKRRLGESSSTASTTTDSNLKLAVNEYQVFHPKKFFTDLFLMIISRSITNMMRMMILFLSVCRVMTDSHRPKYLHISQSASDSLLSLSSSGSLSFKLLFLFFSFVLFV